MRRLFSHFLSRGYGPITAWRFARNRHNDSKIASKMIEQVILGVRR